MGYAVRKDGQSWRAVASSSDVSSDEVFSEAQPVLAPAVGQYEAALDALLDGVAQGYRYADRTRLALRAGYPNQHRALATAFGTWMDQCNDQAKQLYIDVLAGQEEMPTIEAFVAMFPAFIAP